jgi:hypothetical protein
VRIAADIGPETQTLSVNDLVTTTRPGDRIDLLCSVSPATGVKRSPGQITHASIVAIQVTGASTVTDR